MDNKTKLKQLETYCKSIYKSRLCAMARVISKNAIPGVVMQLKNIKGGLMMTEDCYGNRHNTDCDACEKFQECITEEEE